MHAEIHVERSLMFHSNIKKCSKSVDGQIWENFILRNILFHFRICLLCKLSTTQSSNTKRTDIELKKIKLRRSIIFNRLFAASSLYSCGIQKHCLCFSSHKDNNMRGMLFFAHGFHFILLERNVFEVVLNIWLNIFYLCISFIVVAYCKFICLHDPIYLII